MNKLLPFGIIGAIVLIGISVAVLSYPGNEGSDAPNVGQYNVGKQTEYTNQRLEMTKIEPEFVEGQIKVKLSDITQSGLVKFELPDQTIVLPNGAQFNSLPVLAYVAPSGRLVGAISFCEPCSGTDFHIEGDHMVCNACGTRWTLEDLQGVSGGCLNYPPDEIEYQVEGDTVIFDEAGLRAWTPRPL